MNKVRAEVRSVASQTDASAKKMKSSFNDAGSKISASFKKIAGAAAAAFSVKAIVDFSKQCVSAASDLQEVQNVVDTVFGSMSSEINAWAKNAKTQFGLGELSAKQFVSTMGAMLSSMGLSSGDMKTMSLNLTALAADMASFYNLSSDMAFDKIRAGISGEIEPLRQLGINMSVANLEAYALSQGITKSYQAMSQSEQAILRYNYLINATKNAQGDFARTSGSWANQVRVLSETFSQLKSNIGALLIQAFTPLLQMLNSLASKLVEVSNGIKSVFGIKQDTSGGGLSGAAESAGEVGENLDDANKQAQKLKNTISGFDELHIISPETETETSAGTGGMGISNPYGGAFDGVGEEVGKLDEKMQQMLDKLIERLSPVAEAVKLIKDTWTEAWNGGNGAQIIDNLKGYLNSLLDTIHNIGTAFKEAWQSDNAGVNFINTVQQGLNDIIALARSVQSSIAAAFASSSGVDFIKSIINGFGTLIDIVSAFAEGLSAAWDTNSAGTELIKSLMDGFSAVAELVSAVGATIAETFRSMPGQEMFGSLIALAQSLLGIVENVADAFKEAWQANGLGQNVLNGIAGIVTSISEGAKILADNFRAAWNENELGRRIIEALLNAVNSIIERVKSASEVFKEWASGVDFEPLLESALKLAEAFGNLASVIADKLAGIFESVLLPLAEWSIEAGVPELVNALADALNALATILDAIPPEALAGIAAGFLAMKAAIAGFSVVTAAVSGIQGFIAALNGVADAIVPIGMAIQGFISKLISMANVAVVTAVPAIQSFLGRVAAAASSVVSAAGGIGTLSAAFAGIGAAVVAVIPWFVDFESSWEGTKSRITEGVEELKRLPDMLGAAFTGSLPDVSMLDVITAKMNGTTVEVQTQAESIKGAFAGISPAIQGAFGGIRDFASSAFGSLSAAASSAVSGIQSAFAGMGAGIQSAFTGLREGASNIFDGLADTVSGIFNTIKSTISSVASSIGDAFASPIETIKNAFNSLLATVKNIVGTIKSLLSGVDDDISAAQSNASSVSSGSGASARAVTYSIPALPELAGGGILRKATAVVAGEYPGAASNPEIIAPQKMLQQIISKSNESMAADIVAGLAGVMAQQQEQNSQELTAKLSGDDLLFAVEKAKKRRGTSLSSNFAFGGI